MQSSLLLIIVVAAPFITALIAASLPANARNAEAWLSGLLAASLLIITLLLFPQVANGGVIREEIPWLPSLGLNIILRMDGLAWLFCVLITGIGFLVVLYARYYMSPKDPVPRFFAFLLAFMGAMLGLVTAGNIIQLAIFWELTSFVSFLLIGYWYHRSESRDGARMALIVTATGGLALFAGLLVIGHIVGSYDLDVILAAGDIIRQHPLYPVALILMLLGAFTKSAQFPFQFWLPHAMAAPTPVSAYLHSATMVKAGVFLLVRFWPVMSGTDLWFWIVTFGGLTTLIIGAYAALFQRDLKGILAYSTISHLGLITTLLGMSTPLAAVAAIFHIANHATFKASLFMAAGIIDHETGTRDMRKLSGLFRFMPVTGTLAMIAAAAMAGVPLLNGFLSKEMFFTETAVYNPDMFVNLALPIGATLAGMFSVAYSLRLVHGVFFGPPAQGLEKVPHEPPALMRRPIELLVLICLAVGIIPGITIGPYLAAAVTSVLGPDTPYYSLSIWHGFNLPLIMSLIALVGGVLLYTVSHRYLARERDGAPLLHRFGGQRIFEKLLVTVTWRWSRALENILGTRRLQPQLVIILVLAIAAAAVPLWASVGPFVTPITPFDPVFALMWLVGGACALAAAYQAKFHRFAAMILMGGAGLVTCMTFVWFSAPDLALTQLVVEIATAVLMLLGLRWLPQRRPSLTLDIGGFTSKLRRQRDLIIATVAGLGLALMSYLVMTRPALDGIASYFVENAYTGGGGRNVVNVMLVDFRAFDTFGEIVVLGVVALTVFALLRRFRPASESIEKPAQQKALNAFDEASPERNAGDTIAAYLLVPSQIMQWLFPVIIVVAVYLTLRGHDLPGGGFAGGITMSIAFILQYMAGGTRWVEDRLRILPVIWIASGLAIALATGIAAWLFDVPFLTSYFQYADLPLIGRVPIASALLFDLGVFLLVVGSTVLILIPLAHLSVRSPRASRAARKPKAKPVVDTTAGGA
jgi:multicomponent K+:H+ antiporter subunit A